MENSLVRNHETELNLKATELRLGLPGSDDHEVEKLPSNFSILRNNKRSSPESTEVESIKKTKMNNTSNDSDITNDDQDNAPPPPSKAQVVGWPPIRSYRKNSLQQKKGEEVGMYMKVSMAGAPYLRKIDLKFYKSYSELLEVLENMFKCTFGEYSEREGYNGSEFVPTYEDKDGDWMLVGDVPWEMFMSSCKRLRIMKGSEAKGLGCF